MHITIIQYKKNIILPDLAVPPELQGLCGGPGRLVEGAAHLREPRGATTATAAAVGIGEHDTGDWERDGERVVPSRSFLTSTGWQALVLGPSNYSSFIAWLRRIEQRPNLADLISNLSKDP